MSIKYFFLGVDSGGSGISWFVAAKELEFGLCTLYKRMVRTRTIHRISANVSWLAGERVLRMLIGLFVFGYISRKLDPAVLGAYNYSLRMATLFGAIASLGIDGVVIRELINQPERRDEVLGTAFFLKVVGSVC